MMDETCPSCGSENVTPIEAPKAHGVGYVTVGIECMACSTVATGDRVGAHWEEDGTPNEVGLGPSEPYDVRGDR